MKTWCLGNEMDGDWQIGHKPAHDYGHLANEVAKAIRALDPTVELVVCGSSGPDKPSYPTWEETVLDHTYDNVDHISLHMYFDNHANDTLNYLASAQELGDYIDTVAGIIRYIKAKKQSQHDVTICFDEWNVWYHRRAEAEDNAKVWDFPVAPHLAEEPYNVEDMLMVACALNSLLRRVDVVKIACIAQLVNVIAPIMTTPGGNAWRQTTYHPFKLASERGRGTVLLLDVESPTYDCDRANAVAFLDIAATYDDDRGALSYFIVNRHGDEAIHTEITIEGFPSATAIEHLEIAGHGLHTVNTASAPDTVIPRSSDGVARTDRGIAITVPPHGYSVVTVTF